MVAKPRKTAVNRNAPVKPDTPASRAPVNHSVSRQGRNVMRVDVPYQQNRDWEWWLLLTSDRHWDNPKSDREMQRRHLDEVVERGGAWCDGGDLFCAMQGKYDKRSSKSDIRPEHQSGNYLDALVTTAAKWFSPYASHCVGLGHGNHESAIANHHETNLTDRLAALMTAETGISVPYLGFGYWLNLYFRTGGDRGGAGRRKVVHIDHGYGGGGPVTMDMIQHQRRRAYITADVIASGHTHDAWQAETVRLELTGRGDVQHKPVLSLKLPTYKEDYGTGERGWQAETGKPPKPLGAWWLRFTWSHAASDIDVTAIRAK